MNNLQIYEAFGRLFDLYLKIHEQFAKYRTIKIYNRDQIFIKVLKQKLTEYTGIWEPNMRMILRKYIKYKYWRDGNKSV